MSKTVENKTEKLELAKAIDSVGGVVKLSKLLGVPHSSVSRWLNTNMPTPIKHAIKIEKITKGKVRAKDLRPDIFII